MTATTSLKLPDALKATIARVAAGCATGPRQAAQQTVALIFEVLEIRVHHPEMGRKVHGGQRALLISRGRTGYLALRHQRESGYKGL